MMGHPFRFGISAIHTLSVATKKAQRMPHHRGLNTAEVD
jgi:hypothetical protein